MMPENSPMTAAERAQPHQERQQLIRSASTQKPSPETCKFIQKFINNFFVHTCAVCERLWFQNDLKVPKPENAEILRQIVVTYLTFNYFILKFTFFFLLAKLQIHTRFANLFQLPKAN